MMSWAKDKVVLVTGSTSGIGKSIAVEFARIGAQVILTGRNETRLSEAVAECDTVRPQGASSQAIGIPADLSRREDVHSLVERAMESTGGKLDILVNNAGMTGNYLGIQGIADEKMLTDFDSVIEVNLRSVIHLCHLAVPHMLKTIQSNPGSEGCIINISSIASQMTGILPYHISKIGLDMATKCLAAELGPQGIRVNSVNPGLVDTPIIEGLAGSKEVSDMIKGASEKLYPLRRVGLPVEVANTVLFLCSPQSSWTTGMICNVDGGALSLSPLGSMTNDMITNNNASK